MRREQLDTLVHAEPFRPFRVTLTKGDTYEVRHREFFMLLHGTVIIGHPDAKEGERPATIVDLSHIAEAQPLPASASGGANRATGK
jgi:hypothetical protein